MGENQNLSFEQLYSNVLVKVGVERSHLLSKEKLERLDFIAEEDGRWEYEKSIEDFLLILDCANLWAHKNGFRVKETNLI